MDFTRSTALMLVLLNPFLVIIYLVDVVEKVEIKVFTRVLMRACVITAAIFCCFAVLGDAIFADIVQADFASFQIFGGITFLLIGLQFVFRGSNAIEVLRGDSAGVAGAIAMPVLIGPGTISVSVIIGKRHTAPVACSAIILAVLISFVTMIVLKCVHDYVRPRKEQLVQRYIEIAGRIMALYVGTFAIEMIMRGVQSWVEKF